jgi:ABC-2 type transport system permease protein
VSTVSRAPVHRTVVRLGVSSVFGRWRGVLLIALPVVLLALAIIVRVLVGQDRLAAQATLYSLGLVVITPLVALLATSGLLAPEIDDGSIAYLLATPVPRWQIVTSKLLVAFGCVVVFAAVPMLVAGLVLRSDDPALGLGFGLGALAGGAAYCALFAWLSVLTRHAIVIGLIYLLIWEGLLGGLLAGIRWLSISRWSAELVDQVGGVFLVDDLPAAYAVTALLVVIALAAWRTGVRLRGFNLTGDE